jgi:hypothetical protein
MTPICRMLPIALAAAMMFAGCGDESTSDQATNSPPGPGGPGSLGGGPGGPPSKIREALTKLAKGPNSLTPTIGKEVKEENPPWDAIQPQAKEYAQLAATLGAETPPKGDKDSWAKLTAAYSEEATALDKAAQAKDKAAALEAHTQLANSCKACHDAHRPGPGGRGPGMGGPGGPGGPPRPPGYPAPDDDLKKTK